MRMITTQITSIQPTNQPKLSLISPLFLANSKFNTNTMSSRNSSKLEVAANHIGIVFGAKGSFQQKVENDTGTKIRFDQTTRSNRFPVFHISGNPSQCERAKAMITQRIETIAHRTAQSVVKNTYSSHYNQPVEKPTNTVSAPVRPRNRFACLSNNNQKRTVVVEQTKSPTAPVDEGDPLANQAPEIMVEAEPISLDQYFENQSNTSGAQLMPQTLPQDRRPIGVRLQRDFPEPIVATSTRKTKKHRRKNRDTSKGTQSIPVGHTSKIRQLRHQNWIRRQERETQEQTAIPIPLATVSSNTTELQEIACGSKRKFHQIEN